MTKTQVADLLNKLSAIYPKAKIEDPEAMLEAWAEILEPYSADDIKLSANRHARTNRFFPEVSELIQNIIPAHYDRLGIPEQQSDPEKIRNDIKRAVSVEKDRLGRELSDEEFIQIKNDVIKMDKLRRKYTRPFNAKGADT